MDGIGSSWTASKGLNVGPQGSGSIAISNGATFASAGPYDVVGNYTGGSGAVTVDGKGSAWKSTADVTIGQAGVGTVTVDDGADFDTTGGLLVGSSGGGVGTLKVQNGSTVTSGGTIFSSVGSLAGSQGTVTIDGPNSTWHVNQTLSVGGDGTGAVTVDQGTITASGADGATATGLEVGGAQGGTGTLTVRNGGTFESAGAFDYIGRGEGSQGTVSVDGAGSLWESTGIVAIGAATGSQGTVAIGADAKHEPASRENALAS